MPAIQRALISVSDKRGIVELAQRLWKSGVEILSTGGTAQVLRAHGISVIEVSDYTGFPEIMGGRVKTLHPKVHGGILGRRGIDEAVMKTQGIAPIDLVIVNLYPFEATVARPECDLTEAIENIDIGGPALLRAAAKNYQAVTVVVDPEDYKELLNEFEANSGVISEEHRYALAIKAFTYTARYDAAIARYLEARAQDLPKARFPSIYTLHYIKRQDLRYGENPHQRAAFYCEPNPAPGSISAATQIQGKELSFNNIADTDAALECATSFAQPTCVIVKHANPCGVALGENILQAYERAYATDPISAFGGIIAFNRPLDKACAAAILERQFVEVIAAPAVDPEAAAILAQKPEIRVLVVGTLGSAAERRLDHRGVHGGVLVQDHDQGVITPEQLKVVSRRPPTERELNDLLFAWQVVKFVKSNAIVYAREGQTIGIGAGQMSRVYSARLGVMKAVDNGFDLGGSVMASDAFFPFRDGIDTAAQVGVSAVIQPGGSIRDKEVITAADEHTMAMVFTGMRHFRH